MNMFENAKVGDKVLWNGGYHANYNIREITEVTKTGNVKIGTMIFKKENGEEKSDKYSRAAIKPFDQKILDAQIENNMRIELSRNVAAKLRVLATDMMNGHGSMEQSKKLEALLTEFGYKV